MNILYLIDPKSIHDQKWVSNFTSDNNFKCYFICRSLHFEEKIIEEFQNEFNINFLGSISHFSFKRIIESLKQIKKLKKLIVFNEIKLFHIQFAEPNALWAIFRRYLGVPIIITCRGTDVLKTIPIHFSKKNLLNRLVAWAYKKSFNKADWITVTSVNQKDSINSFCETKNISIIRTGVDLSRLYSNSKCDLPIEITKPYILFPRYIKPLYNHEFCIEAIAELPKDTKEGYQFVFVGKDSGDAQYQNQLIKSLDELTVDYIILSKQSQQEIWGLYSKAKLIVMTPKSDGSPVSGMEAIALKKKLILGPLNYDKEIFSEKNVYKIKKWDKYELAETIIKALNEKETYSEISNEYLHKINNRSNMKQLYKLYNDLIQRN